jgi:branched-chain amino acid transport system ATP-binding protein
VVPDRALAIARALSRKPRLLMLDEMSLGLAPVIVARLLPVVRDYATSTGTAKSLSSDSALLAASYLGGSAA